MSEVHVKPGTSQQLWPRCSLIPLLHGHGAAAPRCMHVPGRSWQLRSCRAAMPSAGSAAKQLCCAKSFTSYIGGCFPRVSVLDGCVSDTLS